MICSYHVLIVPPTGRIRIRGTRYFRFRAEAQCHAMHEWPEFHPAGMIVTSSSIMDPTHFQWGKESRPITNTVKDWQ